MSIDRKIHTSPFRGKGLTRWSCPTCGKGLLKVKDGTFHHEEKRNSKRAHSDEYWEPDWIEYLYSCLLECNNKACKDGVSNSGVGSVYQYMGHDEKGEPSIYYEELFYPKYFSPPLKIFKYKKSIPDEVKNELENSFSLFFCDPPSAANHVRMALENAYDTHEDKTISRPK